MIPRKPVGGGGGYTGGHSSPGYGEDLSQARSNDAAHRFNDYDDEQTPLHYGHRHTSSFNDDNRPSEAHFRSLHGHDVTGSHTNGSSSSGSAAAGATPTHVQFLSNNDSYSQQDTRYAPVQQDSYIKPEAGTEVSEKAGRPSDRLNQWWILELLSCVCALGLLAAIFGILYSHDGRQLSEWPYSITINAFISFLATLMKAFMLIPVAEAISQLKWLWFREDKPLADMEMYDVASRGPFGAARLFWRLRGWHFASIGAFITVVALGIDPFAQQIVRYVDRTEPMPLGNNATILRSNNFNRSMPFDIWTLDAVMDLSLKASIYDGLFNMGSNNSAAVSGCNTGNCTFPKTESGISYKSIGVCTKCNDVTNLITKSCRTSENLSVPLCNYSLPNGLGLTYPILDAYYARSSPVPALKNGTTLSGIGTTFANFSMINYAYRDCNPNTAVAGVYCPQNNTGIFAGECALYPCVKSYSASVSDAIVTESVLSEFYTTQPLFPPAGRATGKAPLYLVPPTCIIDGQLIPNTTYMTSTNMTGNSSYISLTASGQPLWLLDECVYRVNDLVLTGLLSFFRRSFNTTTRGDNMIRVTSSTDIGQVLWYSGNATSSSLNATFKALAQTMTDNMRLNGYGDPAVGTIWQNQTFVKAEWGWISLPLALVVATWVFLGMTMWHSRNLGIWKSSQLALLFHGLEGSGRGRDEVITLKEMQNVADAMVVKLSVGEKRELRLRQTQ